MLEQRDGFRRRVEELVSLFEAGVDGTEWVTRRYPKRIRDDDRQVYEVPALYLQKGPTKLLLDPIGYDIPGAEAAAEISLMPVYDPTASLYHEGGRWVLYLLLRPDPERPGHIVAGPATPLSAEDINEILDTVAEHAVPSV